MFEFSSSEMKKISVASGLFADLRKWNIFFEARIQSLLTVHCLSNALRINGVIHVNAICDWKQSLSHSMRTESFLSRDNMCYRVACELRAVCICSFGIVTFEKLFQQFCFDYSFFPAFSLPSASCLNIFACKRKH